MRYMVSVLVVCLLLNALPGSAAARESTGGLEGTVTTGQRPVAGARVFAAGTSVRTDAHGRFRFPALHVPDQYRFVDVVVRAPRLGQWKLSEARLVAGDTLRVTAEMQAKPVALRQPRPRAEATDSPLQTTFTSQSTTASNTTVPDTIRVYVTGSSYCNPNASGTVKVVDFKRYVKHVLAHEWMPSWPRESLRAGAMATKSYGWYQINYGGKWPGLGADVMDSTCDQVYNPAVSYASTDKAVDDTWAYRITRNGNIHVCYYWAGYQNDGRDPGTDQMSQWGSEYWARQGESWSWILHYYYDNTVISSASTSSADITPPKVRAPIQQLVTGSKLGATLIPMRLSWSASDADSDVKGYQLQQQINSGSYTSVYLTAKTSTKAARHLSPGYYYRYRVRAVDGAGNWSKWAYGPRFYVRSVQESHTSVQYKGTWKRQTVSSAYGGYLRHASTSGASFKLAFRGRNVAWVAQKGAYRGRARVYLDGNYIQTIDLRADSLQSRVVAYSRRWGWLGDHVLEVRVEGTLGRPRVDLDAVVVLR